MVPGYDYLSVLRINRIMQALQDVRELPQELKFVNRTPIVPAIEGEIVGRWINRVQIADIVSDDQAANTYSSGMLSVENVVVPNLKVGRKLTQENLNQLAAINNIAGSSVNISQMGGNEIFGNILPAIVDDLRTGVYQRMEQLLVAMHLDQLTYNRHGIQINGTWGIPSDLKVTPAIAWTDPVNATPVNDIWTLKRLAAIRYGQQFDRMTMSTQAFIFMISTAEFQAKARTFLAPNVSYVNLPLANTDQQKLIASAVTGIKEIEFYDARYWSQDESGTMTSAPYLPINTIILDNTENDNNPAIQDFANGVTTESLVSGLLPNSGSGIIGSFSEGMRGPIAYTTANPSLNPPNISVWAVSRGFPRRYRLQCSATLTIGQFTDTAIPLGMPFFPLTQ